MHTQFSSFEAYIERYKMFYNEEGEGRPPLLSPDEFKNTFRLLQESYQTYKDLMEMGQMDQASNYYAQVINKLENQLAIADASDNFDILI
ncbi:hypothetical protein [Hazenella coriacea]|nr:hypothetical protein [Hazenella coriacea]